MPKNVPQPVRNRHAVIVGAPGECAATARQLDKAGWKVTIVTREKCSRRDVPCDCNRRVATELVCATGIEYLEALVLRRIDSRRIEAFNASAHSIV
jgi:shikimate 5-dehydrogenase